MVGEARFVVSAYGRSGELAIAVADDWQGQGVALALTRQLLEAARAAGSSDFCMASARQQPADAGLHAAIRLRCRHIRDGRRAVHGVRPASDAVAMECPQIALWAAKYLVIAVADLFVRCRHEVAATALRSGGWSLCPRTLFPATDFMANW